MHPSDGGRTLSVWSGSATGMELRLFDPSDPDWLIDRVPMERDDDGVWTVESDRLDIGVPYALGVSGPEGPQHRFEPERNALAPYAKGIVRTRRGEYRATVIDRSFDWAGVSRPEIALDREVVYEVHAKGFSKLNHAIPAHLRGTYAGLAHPESIAYLQSLGVTTVQLLPVHQFVSEQRLLRQGRVNYWGYNTLGFFTPHNLYASRDAQFDTTGGVLREFKGMVRLLHEAGIKVYLDVVYNHTSEEGIGGHATSLRLIDNANYYRQTDDGQYIDTTGVGNTVNTATPAAEQLVIDSLRYWANEVQIDGFRFDLAASLGRDAAHEFTPEHPLLRRIADDDQLSGIRMIAEPWDVGMGGWQTGSFPEGFSEWNDRYRDTLRDFWLTDSRELDHGRTANTSTGAFAHAVSGSAGVFSADRGPLAQVSFVTAHDGFTLADLASFDAKHNEGNGEQNADGSDNNRSYNHGAEGQTDDEHIRFRRRKAMRNLMASMLTSAGIPMLTAGDEWGRTQRGNNNAYNQDSALTWLLWDRKEWQQQMLESTKRLLAIRRASAALRPIEFGEEGKQLAHSSQIIWCDASGEHMSQERWEDHGDRTVQHLVSSTPIDEPFARTLVITHADAHDRDVTLPSGDGMTEFALVFDSALDVHEDAVRLPGETVQMTEMSVHIYEVRHAPDVTRKADAVNDRTDSPPSPPAPTPFGTVG